MWRALTGGPAFARCLGPLPSRAVAAVAVLVSRYVWYKLLWEWCDSDCVDVAGAPCALRRTSREAFGRL